MMQSQTLHAATAILSRIMPKGLTRVEVEERDLSGVLVVHAWTERGSAYDTIQAGRARYAMRCGGSAFLDLMRESLDYLSARLVRPVWRFRIHTHARKLRRVS